MSNIFYTITIYPIYQIIEFVYRAFFLLFKNVGISVIGVSVAVTLLCLPLYAVAEKWQEEERLKKLSMQSWISHIKKSFKGDEQYMILSTFYRQNNYKPIMALRSSFGLLIQIPFFIAAYSFLSHNSELVGESFLFIKDMGNQDKLLTLGSFSINVLPVLMTLINIASGAIYTKGFSFREKAQLYLMALLFLVVLYTSPSGLVLYWTMNNIFSFVKNIFYKMKNPLKTFFVCCCACTFLVQLFLVKNIMAKFTVTQTIPKLRIALLCLLCGIYLIPLLLKATKKVSLMLEKLFCKTSSKSQNILFIITSVCTALLSCVIVSNAISTSVSEFSFIGSITNPVVIVKHTLFTALGFCLLWPTCIYFLFSKKVKNFMAFFSVAILLTELVNVFVFSKNFGTMSNIFSVEYVAETFSKSSFINLLVIVAIFGINFILFRFFNTKIVTYISIIFLLATSFINISNVKIINNRFTEYSKVYIPKEEITSNSEITPVFNFSKSGRNIVVLTLDRAQGKYVEEIFSEKPELKKSFDGFTFYKNTISFGPLTLVGSPPIYGGYEYTPLELNKRKDELIVDKHREAIQVLPTLLYQNGFDVVFTDSGHGTTISTVAMEDVFNKENKIKTERLIGKYDKKYFAEKNIKYKDENAIASAIIRNSFFYSLLCKTPVFARKLVTKNNYWSASNAIDEFFHILVSSYSELYYLPQLSSYSAKNDCANIIINETPHDAYGLKPPEYDDKHHIYSPNMVSYLGLEKWFEELKENEVYDNTRIIIVSDHGIRSVSDRKLNKEAHHPILFVKDFDSHGELKVDNTFMTNADVPFLALQGIAESNNLINPFTHKKMQQDKKDGVVVLSFYYNSLEQNGDDKILKMQDNQLFFTKDGIENLVPYKQ